MAAITQKEIFANSQQSKVYADELRKAYNKLVADSTINYERALIQALKYQDANPNFKANNLFIDALNLIIKKN